MPCAVLGKNWSIAEVELESIYFYWVDICADHLQSHIQALFLDAIGPLTGLLDSINKDEIVVTGRAALTLLGNASSQCNTDRRLAILEEHNKKT